jgi:hypothetical protein
MSEIRSDIFPNISPNIRKKEIFSELFNIPKEKQAALLEEYKRSYRQEKLRIFTNEAYQGISSQFQSESTLIDYINSLPDPVTAELFINVCKFYSIVKKHQQSSIVKLTMIFSIIERLMLNEKKWQEFPMWISNKPQRQLIQDYINQVGKIDDQEAFIKIIDCLKEKYYNAYGSRRNIVKFFKSCVSPANKIKLIGSFKPNLAKVIDGFNPRLYGIFYPIPNTLEEVSIIIKKPVTDSLMPYCFNWQKCSTKHNCGHNSKNCQLSIIPSLLDTTLERVVKVIYQLRNDFVHSARITPLGEYYDPDAKNCLSIVSGVFGPEHKPLIIRMFMFEFESIFEQAIKKYFDDFIKTGTNSNDYRD